jgi:hypothetical protein
MSVTIAGFTVYGGLAVRLGVAGVGAKLGGFVCLFLHIAYGRFAAMAYQ